MDIPFNFLLEHTEDFGSTRFRDALDMQNVKSDSFRQWSAFTDGDDISFFNVRECRGKVSWDLIMSLFETVVFSNVVQVVTTNNNGSLHFVRYNNTTEDTSTDTDVSGEWALLVNISSVDGFLWGLEA